MPFVPIHKKFFKYSIGKRYLWMDLMIKEFNSQVCPHCGVQNRRFTITTEEAYGPEYHTNMDIGAIETLYMCSECLRANNHWMDWEDEKYLKWAEKHYPRDLLLKIAKEVNE